MRLIAAVVAVLLALTFVLRVRVDTPDLGEATDGASVEVSDSDGKGEVRVDNVAIDGTADEVDQAIADIKTIGLWDDLTDHLYEARISTRPDVMDVPDDGHLAHAYLTGGVDEQGSGAVCDITFFPAAMDQELARYERWADDGKMDFAPTRRQFWAQILGHELAHCIGDGQREDIAELWEREVLDRLVDEGIGSHP